MKKSEKITPLLLSLVFVPAVIIFSIIKLSKWPLVMQVSGGTMVVLYFLWLLSEMNITKGEIIKGKSTRDKRTCELYAFVRSVTVLTTLAFPTLWPKESIGIAMVIGFVLFVAGVVFRLVAIRNLGRFYSHRVRILEDQEVISSGPYRIVRHPAYTGMLVANAGMVLFFFNWVSLAILLFAFVPAIVRRISIEETNLFELRGYSEYAEKKYRLIPFIW